MRRAVAMLTFVALLISVGIRAADPPSTDPSATDSDLQKLKQQAAFEHRQLALRHTDSKLARDERRHARERFAFGCRRADCAQPRATGSCGFGTFARVFHGGLPISAAALSVTSSIVPCASAVPSVANTRSMSSMITN